MQAPIISSLLISCVVIGLSRAQTSSITPAELATAQATIRLELINELDLVPEFVRMIFHDCVGSDGCNGCLDVNTPANAGLIEAIEIAESWRTTIAPGLTQADFNVLLGTEAAKLAMDRAGNANTVTDIPFHIGREDCATITADTELPPGETLDTVNFFHQQFEMSPKHAVAIMGGHSLGHVHEENTGFDGHWDNTEAKLDNVYFKNMITKNYKPEPVDLVPGPGQSFQWNMGGELMMLPSDMIMLLSYGVSADGTQPTCSINECLDNPVSGQFVREFAADEAEFQSTFIAAFIKMVTHKFIGNALTQIHPVYGACRCKGKVS